MKKGTKKPNHSIKILLKNGYLFLTNFWSFKRGLTTDLMKLMDKWPSPHREEPFECAWEYKFYKDVKRKKLAVYSQRIKFINLLKEKKKSQEFYKDINNLLKKYDFGYEWFQPMIDFVVSFWLYPPSRNLDVRECEKRVTLTLNPDTSLEDITKSWPMINKKQRELWPNFKRTNLTKKTFKNLEIAVQDIKERYVKGKIRKIHDGDDFREYKITDRDIVTEIWDQEEDDSSGADKKRMQNLRQIRKRIVDKLP